MGTAREYSPPPPPHTIVATRGPLLHGDTNFLDCVAAVAKPVPFGPLGLGAASEVGGPCPNKYGSAGFAAGQQLPPLPAISATLADQSGGLPRAAAHGDVDTIDGRRPRPRDTTHNQFSCGHRRASGRLCDQRPDLLQTHGLASDAAVAL